MQPEINTEALYREATIASRVLTVVTFVLSGVLLAIYAGPPF